MRRRHPGIVWLHWGECAYTAEADGRSWDKDEEEDCEPPLPRKPLYPIIQLAGPHRFELQWWISEPTAYAAPEVDCIDIVGPLSDDVVPIILDGLMRGVYLRTDVAQFLQPHMGPSQRLITLRCDGEMLPYHALVDVDPKVRLPEDWTSQPCDEGAEFEDDQTITHPIFPDRFDPGQGVHFAAWYGNFFLTTALWASLRKRFPAVKEWLQASRIVVESDGSV